MTPMIDVVFLLLVFFVCASIGQTPDTLLPATLNSGTTQETKEPMDDEVWEHQQVRIHVSAGGDPDGIPLVRLNEQLLAGIPDLRSRLQRLADVDPLSPVILDIDDDVQVQQFITVYDLCQSLKFNGISFATRRAGAEN